jgi:hypothetical protein
MTLWGRGRECAREFWTGLTAPTLLGLVSSLALAALEFGLLCAFVTPRRLAKLDPSYLKETSGDEYARLSIDLLKYRASRPKNLQVVYLGASQATRALLWREPEALSKDLSRRVGQAVDFKLFSANNQRYEDQLLIVDQLPPSFRGVVLFAVGVGRNRNKASGRGEGLDRLLAKDAPMLEGILEQRGVDVSRTGNFFIDHLRFFAARRVALVRLGEPSRFKRPNKMDREERVEEAKQKILRGSHLGSTFRKRGRTITERALKRMNRRGIVTVLYEPPNNPFRAEFQADALEELREEAGALAAASGAELWDFDDLELRAHDFKDAIHLGSRRGRRRFQEALFERLANLMQRRFGDES